MDKLALMLETQRSFMDVIGIRKNIGHAPEERIFAPELMSAAVGVVSEGAEVLDALNTKSKPWKSGSPASLVEAEVKEETIDALFYVLEIFNLLGVAEAEIYALYNKKVSINAARVLSTLDLYDLTRVMTMAQGKFEDGAIWEDYSRTDPVLAAALRVIATIDQLSPNTLDNYNYIYSLSNDPKAYVRSLYDGVSPS